MRSRRAISSARERERSPILDEAASSADPITPTLIFVGKSSSALSRLPPTLLMTDAGNFVLRSSTKSRYARCADGSAFLRAQLLQRFVPFDPTIFESQTKSNQASKRKCQRQL